MQGQKGTWGSGQEQKDSNSRDGNCRPVGVDACQGGQALQYRKRRGIIGCEKSGAAQSKGGRWGGWG